ncbi:MAG TPA: DUF4349 domain-containing protein [Firmicutes bacterium]|nr:DUF4349 domain-containing protein [Bacillota bacterium]
MTTKRILLISALVIFALLIGTLLTSCAAGNMLGLDSVSSEYPADYGEQPSPEYDMDLAEEAGAPDVRKVQNGSAESAIRHIIRNGSIDLSVKDTRETIQKVRELVSNVDGIISSSNIYEIRDGQYGANLTLRVPENRFDAVMEQLEDLGKVNNTQTGMDDVTMQYIDLESRLNNQKAQEERLVEILEMAENVEEVLEVEKELARVRGEIESMTSQLNYLKDQVTYGTIFLNLREEAISAENISPGAFHNLGQKTGEAFITSINFILNAISYIIIAFSAMLPVLVVIGVIALLIWLLIRRLSRRKQDREVIKKD